VPVGGDHPLVDAPGGLDLDVLIDGEQGRESGGLLVGEQVGTGVQGSRGQVRAAEGSVKHVEVFQMGGLGTPSSEDLDTYPGPTRQPPSNQRQHPQL
jgi:hypothetical protein